VEHGGLAVGHSWFLIRHNILLEILPESITVQSVDKDSIPRKVFNAIPVGSWVGFEYKI